MRGTTKKVKARRADSCRNRLEAKIAEDPFRATRLPTDSAEGSGNAANTHLRTTRSQVDGCQCKDARSGQDEQIHSIGPNSRHPARRQGYQMTNTDERSTKMPNKKLWKSLKNWHMDRPQELEHVLGHKGTRTRPPTQAQAQERDLPVFGFPGWLRTPCSG